MSRDRRNSSKVALHGPLAGRVGANQGRAWRPEGPGCLLGDPKVDPVEVHGDLWGTRGDQGRSREAWGLRLEA